MSKRFDYDPKIFLRCHSKNDKEYGDVRTQIWHACFEPSKTSYIVATCGGNKICLIDVETGDINQRYSADNRELFYTIAWTRCSVNNEKQNILVAGGSLGILYFMCPSKQKQISHYTIKESTKSKIYSILFHYKKPDVLFCAMSNGDIHILKVHLSLKSDCQIEIVSKISTDSEITRMAVCEYSTLLFAATMSGLYGWIVKSELMNEWDNGKMRFKLPRNPNDTESENSAVDSIEVMENGFFAVKCALHGVIYICHFRNVEITPKSRTVDVIPTYILNWSSTDNYYLEISANYDKGLLTCGDDKGSIWLYDISCLKDNDNINNTQEPKRINPVEIIEWPIIKDLHLAKSRKLDLKMDDIVISKAAIHRSGNYIAVATNRNTVCIWTNIK